MAIRPALHVAPLVENRRLPLWSIWTRIVFIAMIALSTTSLFASEQTSLSCTLDTGGIYAVSQWVPVSLRLANRGDAPGDGYVAFPVGRDSGVVIRQNVKVPPHSVVRLRTALFLGLASKPNMAAGEVTGAVWYANDGKELDRTAVMGSRLGNHGGGRQTDTNDGTPGTLVLTVNTAADAGDSPATQTMLGDLIPVLAGIRAADIAVSDIQQLPRSLTQYQPFGYVVLAAPPDDLDAAQRQALLDHVRQGGVLILPSPPESAHVEESWLGSYLPVRVIGYREAPSILPAGEPQAIKLLDTVPITEAVAANPPTTADSTQVVLRDADYVHAAVCRLGLGRIIFTSFPVAALSPKDGRTRPIWRRLLGLEHAAPPAVDAHLASEQRFSSMTELLGRPAPTWKLSLAVAGGYVLLVLGIQLSVGGVRRPLAFALVGGIAVVTCVALVVVAQVHHSADPVSGARLGTLDLGADGQGQLREQYAFYGRNIPDLALAASQPQVVGQPVDFDPQAPPTLIPLPFGSPNAGVHAEGVRNIWQADTAYPAQQTLRLNGVFGADGLKIASDSTLPATLQSPLLKWGSSLLRLADVSAGQSSATVSAADLNPPGLFTHGGGLVSQVDRLRGQRVQALMDVGQTAFEMQSTDVRPEVIGWMNLPNVSPLLDVQNASPLVMHGQIMVRAAVRLEPSPIGSTVRVDGPFNQLKRMEGAATFPLDANRTASATGYGQWIIAIAPPREVGKIKPAHATMSVDLDAPQQVVTIQAAQFVSPQQLRTFAPNTAAPVLATWSQAIGQHQVSFDVGPEDLSPQGELVLLVSVQSPAGAAPASLPPAWAMRNVQVALQGQVVAGPAEVPLGTELPEENAAPAKASAKAVKKAAAPKAAAKAKKARH
jgi:hypothetical protein